MKFSRVACKNDMDKRPLVSILMTAYNREKYIAEAIESVLASTYDNWELIIVDDCSVDDTVAIARSFEKRDRRIKLFINEVNLGDYPNRNKAATYAKGKYIKYLDSDDKIYNSSLALMVDAIEKFPEAGIVMMWPYDDEVPDARIYSSQEALREYFIFNRWLMVGPSGCLYTSKAFFEIGGFSGKNYVGDFEFNLKCVSKFPIVKVQNNLIYYRIHDQQQGKEEGHQKAYRTLLYKIQKDVLENQSCPLSKDDRYEALKKINKLQARRILLYFLKSYDIKETINIGRDSGISFLMFMKGLINI